MLSPLAGLRAWMLQHAWIFHDLEALTGSVTLIRLDNYRVEALPISVWTFV